MKNMTELLQEAASEPFSSASKGVLMHAIMNNAKAPGANSINQLLNLFDTLRKQGKTQIPQKEFTRMAKQNGINPQDVVQFCDAILDSDQRDEFGGYGKEVLQTTKQAFSAA